MAIQKSDAILLRKRDLRETSLLLTFFTRDFGKVRGVLKGVRGNRARDGINPLFFSYDQIVFYENKKNDFYIISSCETQNVFLNILKDWDRAAGMYYILELIDVFTEPGEKIESIFESLLNVLKSLDAKKEVNTITRFFEVKFLMSLGLWPGSQNFKLTKGAESTLLCFEKDNWGLSSKIKLTGEVADDIKSITGKIIEDNLDRPLKTVKLLG